MAQSITTDNKLYSQVKTPHQGNQFAPSFYVDAPQVPSVCKAIQIKKYLKYVHNYYLLLIIGGFTMEHHVSSRRSISML